MSALDALINHPIIRIFLTGATGVPLQSAARSDVGRDGEINIYRSGVTIVIQIYDATGAAWRSTTLS